MKSPGKSVTKTVIRFGDYLKNRPDFHPVLIVSGFLCLQWKVNSIIVQIVKIYAYLFQLIYIIKMHLVSILGLTGTIIGLFRALPQLIKLLKAKEAFGVSVDSAATGSIVSYGWATYGLLTGQYYVTLATGASGTVFLFITIIAIQYGRSWKEFKIAPIWLLVLVICGFVFKESGLGVVLPVSVLMSNLPQLWIAYKEPDLKDLSLGTWLLSMSDGLVWGVYSWLQKDYSIQLFACFQLITSSSIVLLKLIHWNQSRQQSGTVIK